MKHLDILSLLSPVVPIGHVTALRSQFLSGHQSTCTKRFHLYCDGKNFLPIFYMHLPLFVCILWGRWQHVIHLMHWLRMQIYIYYRRAYTYTPIAGSINFTDVSGLQKLSQLDERNDVLLRQ